MRIYEFAKKHKISSKDVMARLSKGGFEVGSHMSVLGDKELEFLLKKSSTASVGSASTESSRDNAVATQGADGSADDSEEPEVLEVGSAGEIEAKEMSLEDFSGVVDRPVNEVILALLRRGVMCSRTQVLDRATVVSLAESLGFAAVEPAGLTASEEAGGVPVIEAGSGSVGRAPIVAVVGHVDHGKTSLLDHIRKTRVVSREHGGITQHVAAYKVKGGHGDVVFIDTPGHEAFSKMRARGVEVADIVVLVVAADDGVKPQTLEAIEVIKSSGVPVVVALNKIDKASDAQIYKAKQELGQRGITLEEWGGEVVCVPVSAKTGEGIDQLLEMIVLQSEMIDVSAAEGVLARGHILEARVEKGLGLVATVILKHGTLSPRDYFVCENSFGRVSLLIDHDGRRLRSVGTSEPVLVAGFSVMPHAGDTFAVVSQRDYRKAQDLQGRREVLRRAGGGVAGVSGEMVNVLVKADGRATQEAVVDAIGRLSASKKGGGRLRVVGSGVGGVIESDVLLAADTNAVVVGFGVKVESNAATLAQGKGVSVELFNIIYRMLEHLEELLKKSAKGIVIIKKIGEAVVRCVFNIKGTGIVAGVYVQDGKLVRGANVTVWRGQQKVGAGKIDTLQREKRSVKEMAAGFECAFRSERFVDWEVGDRIECSMEVKEDPKA